MRDKSLFHILLGLNVALAAAFLIYLLISSYRNPAFSTTSFPEKESTPTHQMAALPVASSNESLHHVSNPQPEPVEVSPALKPAPTNAEPAQPVYTSKKFGWQDVQTDTYQSYLDSLRAVGCPEEKVRYIILTDINELIAQKRLKEAVANDLQWWRAEPEATVASLLRDKGLSLEEERHQLIAKWLGEEIAAKETEDVSYWNNVQLTGPVLGALPQEDHQLVQEVCAESMDRYQNIFWSAINSGRPLNQVELAKLRQRTRSELVKTLDQDAMQEFLLRYSHNANKLRKELRGFDPTPEEFRKVFEATDPLDHVLQLEYGGTEALSPQQRQRHEQRRNELIKEVLSPERYKAYFLTRDPLYRQAQMMALQYGAPSSAIMKIYRMTKDNESRRKEIMGDGTLTPEQKRRAVNAVYLEQQKLVRKIVSEISSQRRNRATP